jgi:hypothetical protein
MVDVLLGARQLIDGLAWVHRHQADCAFAIAFYYVVGCGGGGLEIQNRHAFLVATAAQTDAEDYAEQRSQGDQDDNDDEDPSADGLEDEIAGQHCDFGCVEVVAGDHQSHHDGHTGDS